ncbi:MAG: hypothetical protein AB2535_20670 [Candidatus Thiodiazotropha endolucinida]
MSQTTPAAEFAALEVDDPTILPAGFPVGEASALQRNVGRTESVFGGVYNIEQAIGNKDYGLAGGLAVEGFEAALLTLFTRGRGGQSVDAPNMQTIATSLSGNTKELAPISTLNNRQLSIFDNLSDAGSPASFHKKAVSMSDLQALTGVTGDEFSMYTLGSRRTIIRGSGEKVIVNQDVYDGLISGLYGKWSGHTHRPGYSIDPGPSDRPMLTILGQKQSSIWPANAETKPYLFGQIGKADDLRLQSDVTRKLWEKLYGQ